MQYYWVYGGRIQAYKPANNDAFVRLRVEETIESDKRPNSEKTVSSPKFPFTRRDMFL